MKRAHPMPMLAAIAAGMMLIASPSSAAPQCQVIAGPVNQGQVFYGVKCNYAACYCQRRVCPNAPTRTWCTQLQMKFH